MPRYIANLTFRLPAPIKLAPGALLPPVSLSITPTVVTRLEVGLVTAGDEATAIDATATYDSPTLTHWDTGVPGREITVLDGNVAFHPPYHVGMAIKNVLYQLSGLTLQANIFSPSYYPHADVTRFTWTLPNGQTLGGMAGDVLRGLAGIRDSGEAMLSATEWAALAIAQPCPLWRLILADAHRERTNDIRNVVLRAATALELAVTPHLQGGRFSIPVLEGSPGIPDMRNAHASIAQAAANTYQAASELWYTRHAIIHHGQLNLFDRRPGNNVPPKGPLTAPDVERFLVAVPRVQRYVASHGQTI